MKPRSGNPFSSVLPAVVAACFLFVSAGGANVIQLAKPGPDGKLVYAATSPNGDTLLDFSHCGYGGGGVELPVGARSFHFESAQGLRDRGALGRWRGAGLRRPWPGRAGGVENLRGISAFDRSVKADHPDKPGYFADEDHALFLANFDHAKNSWARDLTAVHFYHGVSKIEPGAKSITVQASASSRRVCTFSSSRTDSAARSLERGQDVRSERSEAGFEAEHSRLASRCPG